MIKSAFTECEGFTFMCESIVVRAEGCINCICIRGIKLLIRESRIISLGDAEATPIEVDWYIVVNQNSYLSEELASRRDDDSSTRYLEIDELRRFDGLNVCGFEGPKSQKVDIFS